MKKLFFAVSVLLTIAFVNNCFAQVKSKPKSMDDGLAHKTSNSSPFTIGKAAYSQKVLDLWKDWDDNTFDKHDYMADSLVMFLPDGMVIKGKAANIEGAKKYRGSMTSSKSIIYACIPLNNADSKEDAVCIWGQEEDTFPDGKVEKKDIHEVWWFNKDGKVSMMRQWTAKFGG